MDLIIKQVEKTKLPITFQVMFVWMIEDGAFNLGIILLSVNAVCGTESGWRESLQKAIIKALFLKGYVFIWMLKYGQRQL